MQLIESEYHPFAISVNSDTDGFYVVRYQVFGRARIGEFMLTSDDIIARWHQRTSRSDYLTGDIVVLVDSGNIATLISPVTIHNDDGSTIEGWFIVEDGQRRFVTKDQIRIATADEVSGDENAF